MIWVFIDWYRRRHPETYCPNGHPWRRRSPRTGTGALVPQGWLYCEGMGCRSLRVPDGTVVITGSMKAFRQTLLYASLADTPGAPPLF
jgi:hypothetical protein